MLYLAIDLHSRQITVNLRCEEGTILLRRQVSTKGDAASLELDLLLARAKLEEARLEASESI